MKRVMAAILAGIISMSLAMEAFADTPLSASDRVTQQLADIQRRKNEIEQKRKEQQAAKQAAIFAGRNSKNTDNLSYFINRKTLTKLEYEAFKWSFIFSQFAIPMEDSLVDVFSQEAFQEMIDENFVVNAVKEYIVTGSTDTTAAHHTDEMAMLQNADISEIIDTIKRNYVIYSVYNEAGNQPTLSDFLNAGDTLGIYDTFYIYDTVAEDLGSLSRDYCNSLYYNQQILANSTASLPDIASDGVKIPVFVYDANAFLYLQLAVGAYCKANDTTVAEINVTYGESTIVMDSYGNLCFRTPEGHARILVPNFGNPFLTSVEEESSLEESINLYNKWFTTMYTRATRSRNTIYPDINVIHCLDTATTTNNINTGATEYKGDGKIKSPYQNYLEVMSDGNLSNTLLLIETSDVTAKPSDQVYKDLATFDEEGWHQYNGRSNAAGDQTLLGNLLSMFTKLRTNADIDSKAAKYSFEIGQKDRVGILASPYDFGAGMYAPFLASKNEVQSFYQNKYPIALIDIDIDMHNSDKDTGVTHDARFASVLLNSTWKINNNIYHSGISQDNINTAEAAVALSDLVTLIANFTAEQIISDNRFISWYKSVQSNGTANMEIYLPEDPLDMGQNMSAYMNDEKGMFLATYKTYFSSVTDDLVTTLQTFAKAYQKTLEDDYTNKNVDTAVKSEETDKNGHINYISLISDNKSSINLYAKENLWFDGITKSDIQDYICYATEFDLSNAFKQDTLKQLYSIDVNSSGAVKGVSAVCVYVKETINATTGEVTGWNIYVKYGTEVNDENCYLIDTIYYYNEQDPTHKMIPKLPDPGIVLSFLKGIALSGGANDEPEYGEINSALKELKQAISEHAVFDEGTTIRNYPDNMLRYATVTLAKCINATIYNECRSSGFYSKLEDVCLIAGCDPNRFLQMYMTGSLRNVAFDKVGNGKKNIYFYDEYQFLLRSPSDLSSKMGCNTTSDFATVTYFWDRHYLTKSAMQKNVQQEVTRNWTGNADGEIDKQSIAYMYASYLEALKESGLSQYQLPFQTYVENNSDTYFIAKPDGKPMYTPYYYEYGLQKTDFATYSETEKEILTGAESEVDSIFTGSSQLYNYLDPETIILYPFSSTVNNKTRLKVYGGAADGILTYSASATSGREGEYGGTRIDCYALPVLIMALQANTDFVHNTLAVVPPKTAAEKHVTREELMDNANQFYTNPVTSIMYILSGFLYQIHATIATGDIGNAFSLNWLLETDVYKWIINRYVSIMILAIAVILFLKLVQFAMNKSHSMTGIAKDVLGIIAMCLVPLVVFNSFVWAFDATSAWALEGSMDKILLSQINTKIKERVNNDPGVTAELNAFKEQFRALNLDGYDCLSFEQMCAYSVENGPIYDHRSAWEYIDDITFSARDNEWYSSDGFTAVHSDKYTDSLFYFFYDYFRSEYFVYCKNTDSTNDAIGVAKECITKIDSLAADLKSTEKRENAIVGINTQEQALAQLVGGFKSMMEDTQYVYGVSIRDDFTKRYNGPKVKDLAGLYVIFDPTIATSSSNNIFLARSKISKAPYYKALLDSETMIVENNVVPKRWVDASVITSYLAEDKLRDSREPAVITSYHDLFNSEITNFSADIDRNVTINDFKITPLEKKLCDTSEKIYDEILKALNYMPDQVSDEAAIATAALIATCKVNEIFGISPTEPIMQSVTIDAFVRTAFLRNIDDVGSEVNTMYAMVNQGSSIGEILLVLMLELIIAFASICRVLIILYLTVASFVVIGLRLLHKAPRTDELVYGIVGNMMALLALHALTLFLVVVAIEAVAGATSIIPQLLLDVIMIVFTVLVSVLIVKLVKNIAQDALTLGGAKIKGLVKQIGDSVMNVAKSLTNANDTAITAPSINLQANNVIQSDAAQEDEVSQVDLRVNRILDMLEQASDTSSRVIVSSRDSRVQHNLEAEQSISEGNDLATEPSASRSIDRFEAAQPNSESNNSGTT